MMSYLHTKFHENRISSFRGVAMTRSFMSIFYVPRGITSTKMRGSKFPADMHNYIWCPIYIPSFMIIGSVVLELRWQEFGTDGQTDGRSDCTPRPAFAFGDAGKNIWRIFVCVCVCVRACINISYEQIRDFRVTYLLWISEPFLY